MLDHKGEVEAMEKATEYRKELNLSSLEDGEVLRDLILQTIIDGAEQLSETAFKLAETSIIDFIRYCREADIDPRNMLDDEISRFVDEHIRNGINPLF